jgi:hypothetical protein
MVMAREVDSDENNFCIYVEIVAVRLSHRETKYRGQNQGVAVCVDRHAIRAEVRCYVLLVPVGVGIMTTKQTEMHDMELMFIFAVGVALGWLF